MPDRDEWRRTREKVKRRARGKCERCGRSPQPGEQFVVDHIVPLAERPGPRELAELWLLCPTCDESKTAADLARIRESRRLEASAAE